MKQQRTTSAPFLKWAGGKRKQVEYLARKLPAGERLVEPFAGAGAVFMGTEYDRYLLADTNTDLIDLYHALLDDGQHFVRYAQGLFVPANNTEARYYELREQFNHTPPGAVRAALFLYLNRHGYNGLCRYNSAGGFNVPFGAYQQPYFPAHELRGFYVKMRTRDVTIALQDFRASFAQLQAGDVVYCDPPYIPLSKTASFTAYNGQSFDMDDHIDLHTLAIQAAADGRPVVLNNHSHPALNRLYRQSLASLAFKRRSRAINAKTSARKGVVEVTAYWNFGAIETRMAA